MKRRRRSWARARRSALAVLWVAGMVLAVLMVGRELLTSERFAVAEIQILGCERSSQDSLRTRVGVPVGANVFRVDLGEVRDRALEEPWVETVRIRRQLPRAIVIEVTEHEPAALVALNQLYFVDAGGEIIKPFGPSDPSDLPVLTGFTRAEAESGERLRPAVKLARAWAERPLPELSEVQAAGAVGFDARTVDGRLVRLGRPPFSEKLQRLEQILSSPSTESAVSVRLDGERRAGRATVVLAPRRGEGGR